MGVQFFAGRFYKCVDSDYNRVSVEEAPTKEKCLENAGKNFTWINSRINFDNTLNAYLALLQVATFKGWIEIMADAADMSAEVS